MVNLPAKQQGMTLIGFVFILAFLLFIAYLGIKIIPHYLNYFSVVDAMQKVALEPNISRATTNVVQGKLKSVLFVNYAEGIKPENLKVVRTAQGNQIILDYRVEEPIAGNLFVLLHFQKTITLR